MELEIRNCRNCGKNFKTLVTSINRHCCKFCFYEGNKWWDAQRKALKKESKKIESVIVENGKTQSLEKKNEIEVDDTESETKQPKKNEIENTMNKTKKKDFQNELNGDEKTEIDNSSTKEHIIVKTTINKKSMKDEKDEILPTVYNEQSEISKREISSSMSLLDESVKQLVDHMKQFRPPAEDQVRALFDKVEGVNSACRCAAEIAKLIKIKVDAVKVFHDISRDK